MMTGVKPELLAPAGSFDGMRAAINAGADAVYMGGTMFGARAYAQNPDEEGLIKAIEFCHLRNRKLYLTVNTLLKEEELKGKLFDYIKPLYEAGLDAVIVQDIGVMEFIGCSFPGLDIHVSTQASITMSQGIEGIRGLVSHPESITRVVPARELSIEELRLMRDTTDLELEVFIHGALCCCYSGQCLMSSLAGGRSGNRGRCAQPCRKLYEAEYGGKNYKGYYLSPKDMCTLDNIGELIECGIDSFKIEGRMKSEEYAAGVVSIYRKYIDEYKNQLKPGENGNGKEKQLLSELYNRGGFNEGYLHTHNGKEMMSTLRPGHHGVFAGTVVKAEGRKATIKPCTELKKGDVLEIRDLEGEKALYEFTVGEKCDTDAVFSVLTMKDRLAVRGAAVYRTKNSSLLSDLKAEYVDKDSKVPVELHLTARIGEPLKLEVKLREAASYGDNINKGCISKKSNPIDLDFSSDGMSKGKETAFREEASGQPVQRAETSASSSESLKELVSKLGNTDFYAAKVTVDADEGVFVPVQEIKRLRRECAENLKNAILSSKIRKQWDGSRNPINTESLNDIYLNRNNRLSIVIPNECEGSLRNYVSENGTSDSKSKDMPKIRNVGEIGSEMGISVSIRNMSQLKTVISSDKSGIINDIYLEMAAFKNEAAEALSMIITSGKRAFFKLPRILRSSYYDETKDFCEKYKDKVSFIASNYESLALLKEIGADYRTDSNLYCFNNIAKKCLNTDYTLPVELNEAELKSVADGNGELIVYGLFPVMVSAQCVFKTITGKCGAHEDVVIKDPKGFNFRAHSECGYCYNLLYNSAVQCILHRLDRVLQSGCGRLRIDLTFENESETGLVIRSLTRALEGCSNEFPSEIMGLPLTNGHFNRGVE